MRYRNYGITPDRQTALVMMGAILSDTKNLQSENTTYADREALKELSDLAGIKDVVSPITNVLNSFEEGD